MAIELLEMVADQLTVGVPLKFAVLDEAGSLLLARGKAVNNHAQREMLLQRGMFAEFESADEDPAEDPDRPLTLFERWQRCTTRLDRLLGSLGKAGFTERCHTLADEVMALVDRDPDIAIYNVVRQDPSKLMSWGLNHALHCALVGYLASKRVGWPAERQRSLVCAALTMNLAIIPIQAAYARLGKITEGQRERIRAHPQIAHDRLRDAGVEDEAWLRGVLEHHERAGSGGYPEGIANPCEMAVALRMLDIFTSKISTRTGRNRVSVQDAVKQLLTDSRSDPLAAGIVKEIGIVPPGHAVQLASGELGVVIRRGASPQTPKAAVVTDVRGKPVITTHVRDTAQPGYAIRGLDPDPKVFLRVPAERLYGLVGLVDA